VTAFQIDYSDNVATALEEIQPGPVTLRGDASEKKMTAVTAVPAGHKIAVRDIADQEDIVKYGVVIGRATQAIPKGSWVHLHNIRSIYDERSSHLDAVTGAPKDTRYE
jgi:altronate dehydratase